MTMNLGMYNNGILNPGEVEATGLKTPNDGTGLVTINGGDAATVDISATIGIFVDRSAGTVTEVAFPGVTAHTPLNFGAGSGTYYYFDSTGSLVERSVIEVGAFTRSHCMLGISSDNGTIITGVTSYSLVTRYGGSMALHDVLNFFRAIRRSGLVTQPNGANLVLNQTAGIAMIPSINNRISLTNPHIGTFTAITGTSTSLFEGWRSDGTNGETLQFSNTAIQAGVYDDGTAIASDTSPQGILLANKWAVHKLFFVADFEVMAIQYGQDVFNSLAEAITGVLANPYEIIPAFRSTIPAAALLVRGGATALNDVGHGAFRPTDIIGSFH